MDIINEVKGLNLPLEKILVISSGTLDVLGIRKAKDIDIVATKDLYTQLFNDPTWSHKEVPYGINLCKGNVEILPQLEWDKYPTTVEEGLARAMNKEGMNFMSLADVKAFKTALGRDKDVKDISLIEAYEKNNSEIRIPLK